MQATGPLIRILIAGGGIGGIALARLLSNNPNVRVTLYERDSGPTTRDQGLVIGLRQEAIDILMHDLNWPNLTSLLSDLGAKNLALISATSSKPLIIARNVMSVTIQNNRQVSSFVSRSDLRNTMMSNLNDSVEVCYSKQVLEYLEQDEEVVVSCSDGTTRSFDCLVGADGARSHVRRLRCPELEPVELGYWTDAASIPLSDTQVEKLKNNSLFRYACTSLVRKSGKRGVSLLCFVYGQENGPLLLWSVSLPQCVADEYGLCSSLDANAMRDRTTRIASDCLTTEAAELISTTLPEQMFPGYKFFSVLPDVVAGNPFAKNSSSRVTLIGDAAHKTTTQAGLGATAALQDAVLLASELNKLANGDRTIASAFRLYENQMCNNAKSVVAMSVGNTKRIHSTNAIAIGLLNCVSYFFGCCLELYYCIRPS